MIHLIFAYILYVSLFHIISLSGGRQLYALGFSIMTFLYIDKKKLGKSLLCIALGMLIHMSCILALLPLILMKLDVKKVKLIHLITFFLVPITIISANEIIVLMGTAIGIDRYAKYGTGESMGGVWTFVIILVLTSIFCYITLNKRYLSSNRSAANLYTMVPLFTFFGPLIYSNGSMIRISMYFHIYLMVLMPLAISRIPDARVRILLYIFVIMLLMILSLKDGGLIYHFYWEEPHLNFKQNLSLIS